MATLERIDKTVSINVQVVEIYMPGNNLRQLTFSSSCEPTCGLCSSHCKLDGGANRAAKNLPESPESL